MKFILNLLFLLICTVYSYEIPNVKLELLQRGFRVSIPDFPGITEVFYGIEINNKCPPFIKHLRQAVNEAWTTDHDPVLRTGDTVMIFVMVKYNGKNYRKNEELTISNDGKINTNDLNECESNSCTENSFRRQNCMKAETTTNRNKEYCVNELIFEENFKENQLSQNRWSHDIYIALNSLATEEDVLFDNNKENYFIKNDILHIKPTIRNDVKYKIDLTGRCTIDSELHCVRTSSEVTKIQPIVQSAKIQSKKSFNFKYGRVEIRAKLPKGDYILTYIKLQPVSKTADFLGKWDQIPQIHIAFARGNENYLHEYQNIGGKRLYGGIDYYANGPKSDLHSKFNANEHFGDGFHVYTLNWTKDRITVAVDGHDYGTITENLDAFQSELFYLVLGVSFGGQRHFPTAKGADPRASYNLWQLRNDWNATWNGNHNLQVDYVKVFAV